jgi:WD40 repeat protein
LTFGDWTDTKPGYFALWDVKHNTTTGPIVQQPHCINDALLHPNGKHLFTAHHDGTIRVWDLGKRHAPHWKPERTIQAHEHWVWALAAVPEKNLLISAGHDSAVKLWDLDFESDKPLRVLKGHTMGVLTAQMHPQGRILATGSFDNSIILWDLDTGRIRHRLIGHIGPVSGLCFSKTGNTLASCSWDGTVHLWNVETGRHITGLRPHPECFEDVSFRTLAFSRDGRVLSAGDEKGLIHHFYAED